MGSTNRTNVMNVGAPGSTARYRFGDILLDVGRRNVSRNGESIELGRLTFSLLLALVEAAPNVLDHDRIVELVWGGRSTSPETLTQRVKLLRDALSDDADQPRYIGLVRGQGYRLLPPCIRVANEAEAAHAVATNAQASPRSHLGLALGIAAGALGLAVAGIAMWQLGPEASPPDTPGISAATDAIPRSVAILPFVNLSTDPSNAYFAEGFYQTLLAELSAVSDLTVIAGTTMQRYSDRSRSPADVAQEVRAETVMDGGVQFDGDRVRVTVSLVEPQSGAQLWARSYDRELVDALAIQTDIALSIIAPLQARLLPDERRRIESPPTTSAAAYALYLETLVDTDRRRLPLEDDRSRLPLIDRAIALDPEFAAAYLARAEIFTWAVAYSEAGSSPEEIARQADYAARALADAERALELDPTLPGPWIVRGILDLEFWRWSEAAADFAQALELGPNDPEALLQAAFFETYAGRFDQALELARRRFILDPQSVESNNGLGFIAIVAGLPEVAIERYREVARLAPGVWFYHATAALAYLQQADRNGVATALQTADQLRGADDLGVFLTNSAIGYRWLGLPVESQRAFEGFAEWTKSNVVSEGDWALAYQGIGDYESMYAALQRAVARAEAHQPDSHQALILIAANATNDPMLEEPRFRDLRARLLPSGDFDSLQRP